MISNKIALEALKLAGFKNPTAIAEILNYVPNSNVALEMLLGIYEPKPLEYGRRFRKYKWDNQKLIEITAIDELANIVMYNEYKQKTKTVYYLSKEDRDNKVYLFDRPKDYYTTGEVPANGYTQSKNSLSLSDFESNYSTVVETEDAFAELNNWEHFGLQPAIYHYEDIFGAPDNEPTEL